MSSLTVDSPFWLIYGLLYSDSIEVIANLNGIVNCMKQMETAPTPEHEGAVI
ncbi:conserved hypothetical protein [Vibrio harveyi]|jgi:hypothetical protein|nr:hypothetical protein VIBHAR_00359 [Vibrio campbellii ATCC BAA-1116]EDP57854.1 hypothetical protein AND4_16739 [Vibrio sp. AND4]ELU49797.1 hypothetical protein B878_21404 [Vibrio campbellii CAIM 519 = NBRC 15631 = ATCC 25920]EMR37446.1 hypothetical protein MUQ_08093 [Vibrio harveyi CAIM 1792]MBY7703863.1 hypothetical protein [Vibrio harveyi]CAH1573716.1 conserved hypothetical protein [Vibrio owensii]